MTDVSNDVREFANQEYKYGFSTDLDTDLVPKGLSEGTIRLISSKKNHNGSSTGACRRTDIGSRWKSPSGRTSTTNPLTTRTSSTTRPPSLRRHW